MVFTSFVFSLLLFPKPSLAAPTVTAPVGVVLVSRGAQISQITAQSGASLYAGDTLTTDADGMMRVRFGTSQLMLDTATVVKVSKGKNDVALALQRGTVAFSVAGSPIELHVLRAIIRPNSDTSGLLRIVGPNEFQIGSTKGDLIVETDGGFKTIAQGFTYLATIAPVSGDPDTKPGGRDPRPKVKWIPIGAIVVSTAVLIWIAYLSRHDFYH